MKQNTRKVWVNPVERPSAQGRDRQQYQILGKNGTVVNTINMKKTKEKDVSSVYQFPRIKSSQRLYTGLNKRVVNPYYKMNKEDLLAITIPHKTFDDKLDEILEQEYITKQTLLELKYGEPYNALNDFAGPPITEISALELNRAIQRFEETKSQLVDFKFVFYARPNLLKAETLRQELAISLVEALVDSGVFAASKDVANAAEHEFYIAEDNEEEENYSRKRDIIEEATAMLYEVKNKMPEFKAYQYAIILRDKTNRPIVIGESTPERIRIALSEYTSDRNKNQMEHIERFRSLYNLDQTPEGADKVNVMYAVQQAINTGAIVLRNGEYYWMAKSGSPDMYNPANSFDKLVNIFFKDMQVSNPKNDKKKQIVNYWNELIEELKERGVRFK
jgi:hypothetical protein